MRRTLLSVLAILPCTATAAPPVMSVALHYEAYSHGLGILGLDVTLSLDPGGYEVRLDYHTVGLAHFLYSGEQHNSVSGVGMARGRRRCGSNRLVSGAAGERKRYLYRNEHPTVVSLLPPIRVERAPVPPALGWAQRTR